MEENRVEEGVKMVWNIRKMAVDDLPACAHILEAGYSQPPYRERFAPGVALGYLEGKFGYCAGHSFVAVAGEEVVGFILSSLSTWVEGGQALFEEIVVDPAWHRQGIGRSLMAGAEAYFREKDVHSVILWGRKDAGAHLFHEKNGFEDSKEWVIMHKTL